MRKIVFGTLIAFIVVAGSLLIEHSFVINRGVPEKSTETGQLIPKNTKLKNITTGEIIDFERQFKGKVLLVNYWASWCSACIQEMPGMIKLYETLKDKGFELVSINVDDDPEKIVLNVAKKLQISFPIYTEVENKPLEKILNVVAIPTSALVARNLTIVWSESGERDWMAEPVLESIKKELDNQSR